MDIDVSNSRYDLTNYNSLMFNYQIFLQMISNVCSVRIVIAIIATYIIGLSSARQISDKILADHEAEIRLGYSGEASDFKRLVHPKEEYGYQLKSLLFPLKVMYLPPMTIVPDDCFQNHLSWSLLILFHLI